MAVMPGMVNAHTHLFQTFIRGLADDKPLLDWLKAAIWPVAQALTEEEAYWPRCLAWSRTSAAARQPSSTTSTSTRDRQRRRRLPRRGRDGRAFAAGARLGGHGLSPGLHGDARADHLGDGAAARHLARRANGRMRVEFGPLIPWGCTDDTMRRTYALAQAWGVGTHIHVAETRRKWR